jgi:ABC-2 type transport system permease protein
LNGRTATWEQFKAILWLRWRLLTNQLAKSGKFNFVLTLVLLWSLLILSAFALFISFGLGVLFLRYADPFVAMVIWDILIAIFVLMWFIGLMTELQRSEFLSLEKMLQLPMSLKSAFALNYLTSLCTLSIIFFVPTAIGLSFAFAIVHGPALLLLLPILASLVWMVTAVTHQFRGWIASMMVNERWRRRIIVGMTLGFVAMTQLPNIALQYAVHQADPSVALQVEERAELEREANSASLTG